MYINGLDLLFLEVNNLEESLEFYLDQLGLELESRVSNSDPPMATLRAGRLKITLVQQLETMLRRGRGVHFILGVSDVDKYYLELLTRGLDISEPADEGWGGRFISVTDPDKYQIFFVKWHEKGSSWQEK